MSGGRIPASRVASRVFVARAALVATIAMVAASSPARAQDAARGRTLFSACAACHVAQGPSGADGPSLAGVVGRTAASLNDFRYSRPMARSGFVWDEAQLDTYLADPQAVVPGTRMAFSGLPAAADRADVIAYLKTLK